MGVMTGGNGLPVVKNGGRVEGGNSGGRGVVRNGFSVYEGSEGVGGVKKGFSGSLGGLAFIC